MLLHVIRDKKVKNMEIASKKRDWLFALNNDIKTLSQSDINDCISYLIAQLIS